MNEIIDVNNQSTACWMCKIAGSLKLSTPSIHFLNKRIQEENLEEAIDIARIAWDQFPRMREAADSKKMLDGMMEGMQEKLNAQVLVPMSNSTAAMTAIMDRLEKLVETNPSLIEQGFDKTIVGFKAEVNSIRNAIQEPTAKIVELNQLVNQLVYRPIAKGNAGESVLTDLWIEHFTRDQVEKLGGAGREDVLVRPFLGDGDSDSSSLYFGETISVERKTGKQKHTGSHREEAIRHAKERGASVVMLIYDTQENLPQSIRPVSISREQGLLVIVADLQSGSWKIMRETVEIVQRVLHASSKDISAINVDIIQEVVTELANLVKIVDQIKGNNARIKGCADEVEQHLVTTKMMVRSYQDRLKLAIDGFNGRAKSGSETSRPCQVNQRT